jgi:hypothetical protein
VSLVDTRSPSVVIVLLVVTVAFGDPRYHTLADLGVVVLAAVALGHVARRAYRRYSATERLPA